MRDIIKDCSVIIAIIGLVVLGVFFVQAGINGELMFLDIVCIAGLAGYKIQKLPSPPTSR